MAAGFLVFFAGQIVAGHLDYNEHRLEHGGAPVSFADYLQSGHLWEATFENWESEFLQMTAFVLLTVLLYQKGSPESKRIGAREAVDLDPRRFAGEPSAPWPVRRGGWILRVYEHSLGLALALLFLVSWMGHVLAGWRAYATEQLSHGQPAPSLTDYITSSSFWFESLQNWQSEFLSIAAMVWLSVYLRQRGSPESKPVHASHDETGR